jgi:hypothetical protein
VGGGYLYLSKFTIKNSILKLVLSLFLGSIHLFVHSQVAVVSVGGHILSTSGSVSYTVGQIDYTSITGSFVVLYLGVQQVYDPYVTSIDENTDISIWPNPVSTTLNIDVKSVNNLGILYQLYTVDGKLLVSKQSADNRTSLNMMNYAQGVYVLMVRYSNKRTLKFKIIKT